MRFRKRTIVFFVVLALVLAASVFFRNPHFVKIYPLFVTFVVGLQFLISQLFPPTLIEQFARVIDKDFNEDAIPYCRKLNWVWIGFFVVNFAVSLWSAFEPWIVWAAWNCVISYIVMGGLFMGEALFRRFYKRGVAAKAAGFVPPSQLLAMPDYSARGNAFIWGDRTISCARFRQCVAYYAELLRLRPEPRAVVHSEDNALFALGFFAALHAGKEIVLPHNLQSETEKSLSGNVIFLTTTTGTLLDFDIAPEDYSAREHLQEIDRSLPIYFFSSGSTGTPKMIERSWANIEDEVLRLHSFLPEIKTKHILASVRAYHLYGMLYAFILPLSRGNTIVSQLVEFPEELSAYAQKDNAFWFVSSPAFLSRWARDDASLHLGVPAENCVVLSSASLLDRPTAMALYEKTGIAAIEVYGTTETGGIAWRQQAKDELWTAWEPGSIARNDDGALVVRSSLLCKMDSMVMGDAVELIDENRFKLLGRMNRLIKVEDTRVSLPELEEHLQKTPWVQEIFLTLIPNKIGRIVLGAVVVKTPAGTQMDEKTLTAKLKEELLKIVPATVLPKKWRYVPAIPRNEQSKILAKDIEKLFE
ncbi:MAG: AMP-binding protein [Opitutales bacterium]|nr:AMP-binding protein [Opitutales bacterium]